MDEKNQNYKRQDKEKQVEYGVAEIGEDATKYGEFVSSYFRWVSPKQQKEKVDELEHMTDDNK